MATYSSMFVGMMRCFLLCIVATLSYAASCSNCLGATVTSYNAVPFTDTRTDAFYRPHQLITIKLHKDKFSPATSATFLFDTGATHCAISASLAAKLNLPLHPLKDRLGSPLEFNGETAVGITMRQVDIGTFQIKDVPINILPDEQLAQALGQPVDGILGSDIWSSLVVQLNFTKSLLTFFTPASSVSYSGLGFARVSLTASETAQLGFGDSLVVPLLHDLYTYSALFELRNGTKTETQSLLIDTGTPSTTISEPVANNLGLEPVVKANYAAIKDFNVNVSWLSGVHCGDLTLDNLLVASPSEYAQGFVPRLGLDVLANYDILLDFPHQKMYLKPRADLQAVTSHQYGSASSAQRQQWAQKRLMLVYPTLDGYAVSYKLSVDGLPVAQVRTDWTASPMPFLLKSNTANVFISETLVQQWGLKPETMLSPDGKPFQQQGQTLHSAKITNVYFGSAQANGELVILPADLFLKANSYQTVAGVIGANILFSHPVLMDPEMQTWLQIWKVLQPEDLTSLDMADASVVAVQDPDDNDNLILPVEVQQGTAQFTDTMTLATGSPFTLLSAGAAKALKLTPEPQQLRYGAGKDITVFSQAHLSQLSIGGVVLKDVQVAYPISTMPDGFYPRLGMNVISKLRLLVDASAKKMYVKKAVDEETASTR